MYFKKYKINRIDVNGEWVNNVFLKYMRFHPDIYVLNMKQQITKFLKIKVLYNILLNNVSTQIIKNK